MALVLPEPGNHRSRESPTVNRPIPFISTIMRSTAAAVALLVLFVSIAPAQRPPDQKPASPPPTGNQAEPPQTDLEIIKTDTNLVTIPVIASSRTGTYISDLSKEEFKISEDGVSQQVAFLATTTVPFYLVLMLDTSDSTQERLPQIQQAAITFLQQLGPQDKVKVISFDGELHDLNDFTSDKSTLRRAIEQTRSGHDTHVYDAVQMAIDALRPIQQRKAIVVFTDGMDWHSERATFDSTLHDLDEAGVIVYPIRFDTRAFTEQLARKQSNDGGVQLPTSDILRQPGSGTTPTTFPGDDPSPVPTRKRPPLPIPPPNVIFGRGDPNPTNNPPNNPTMDPFPAPSRSPRLPPTDRDTNNRRQQDDSLSGMLDQLYLMADSYLADLAQRTGGQVYRADTVSVLPQAFAAIAAELRTQYLLGYYPTNKAHDSSYRKIQVKTTRKDIAIRARPGYRAKGR